MRHAHLTPIADDERLTPEAMAVYREDAVDALVESSGHSHLTFESVREQIVRTPETGRALVWEFDDGAGA